MKTGVKKDGTITANAMKVLTDTGAYGCHALTVTGNTGHKSMALYVGDGPYRKSPNIRFDADIVYTNHPPAGAYRGYGVPQGYWPLDRHMEKIARKLGFDPLEFRLKNALRAGELHPFSTAWSEGREPRPETIETCALDECVRQGKAVIGWDQKYGNPAWHMVPGKPHLRRGIGVALVMQGTAIPYLDMGGASLKMNDDGSFNLLIGATDLGTGSDTVLGQMAAETLGVPLEDILVYSSDTDFTPFDKGAYASSTTYISGAAVAQAAEQVAERIRLRAARMLNAQSRWRPDLAARGYPPGRSQGVCAGWELRHPARGGLQRLAPRRPGADHGGGFVQVACIPSALCRPVCRSHRGYRDRAGGGGSAGDGGQLRRDRQPDHRLRTDRRGHDPGAGLCGMRGNAL